MPHRPRASRLAALVLVTAALMTAGIARAQENPPPAAPPPAAPPPPATTMSSSAGGFGAPGTWVFTFETADNGSGFAFFHKTSDGGSTVTLNPGVDYFVAPNISLGANLLFSHTSGGGSSVGGDVRAGYNLAIIDNVGFWPSARFFVVHNSMPSNTSTAFGIFAPFIWHLTTHFFLGGGPDLNHGLSGGSYTEYGLDFILGGWL